MNRYIYIIGTVCVLFVVATLFIKLLPFLIVAGIIIYAVVKLKGKIEGEKRDEDVNGNIYKSNSSTNSNAQDVYTSSDDYTNGEIIDVDYEDVDNK
ncbi:MAG: hypothetical protein ACLU7E_05335 [Clostridium butyricum]